MHARCRLTRLHGPELSLGPGLPAPALHGPMLSGEEQAGGRTDGSRAGRSKRERTSGLETMRRDQPRVSDPRLASPYWQEGEGVGALGAERFEDSSVPSVSLTGCSTQWRGVGPLQYASRVPLWLIVHQSQAALTYTHTISGMVEVWKTLLEKALGTENSKLLYRDLRPLQSLVMADQDATQYCKCTLTKVLKLKSYPSHFGPSRNSDTFHI